MSVPAIQKCGAPAVFEPKKAKKRDAQAGAVIDYAKCVRDWPMLEAAIDQKMEDQTEFVRWWEEKVNKRGKRGKGKTSGKN